MSADAALRHAVQDLYAAYAEAIDDERLAEWPDFFTDPCLYRIVAKENYDRGLPLSLMRCESRGMLQDRALASSKLNVHAPRTWRHSITQIRIDTAADVIAIRANFAIFESLGGEPPRILVCGRYRDHIVSGEDGLKFRAKICIYDNSVIPGSIVYPI